MLTFIACVMTATVTTLVWFFIFDFKKLKLELQLMEEKSKVRQLRQQYDDLLVAARILQGAVSAHSRPLTPLEKAYKVFGLDKSASFQEVKNKYKILVKQYHPDKLKTTDSSKFREVNDAYALIKSKVSP